jgi:hypothetical protein
VNAIASLPWFAWIAIVAIVTAWLSTVLQAWTRHRERMAMIAMGMHPDAPTDPDPSLKPDARSMAEL